MAKEISEFQAKLTADDQASKKIDAADKAGQKFDKADYEAGLDVDDKASKGIQQADKAGEEFDGTIFSAETDVENAKALSALDQIEQDAKELKERLEKPVELDVDATKAKRGLDEVGKSADSSKSVLANMIGNTTQDLGAMGGAAGSAGVAIGQMGEYMADALAGGEGLSSVLASFGTVALPVAGLAAISIILPKIIEAFTGISEAEKIAKDTAKDLTEAFHGLDSGLEGVRFGAIADDIKKFIGDTDDLGEHIVSLGIDGGDIAAAMQGKFSPAIQRVRDDLSGMNTKLNESAQAIFNTSSFQASGASFADAYSQAEVQLAGQLGITTEELRARRDVENDVLTKIDAKVKGTNDATSADNFYRTAIAGLTKEEIANGSAVEKSTALAQAHTDVLDQETKALLDLNDATKSVTDSRFAYNKAARDSQQAIHDLDDGIKKINASKDDEATKERNRQQLYDDTTQKVIASAEAQSKLAEDTAKASGKTLTATEKLDNYNASLLASASATSGPVHDSLVQHIADVNGIPPEKVTEILAKTPNLEEQKKLLDEASKARTATITVNAINLQKIIDDYDRVKSKSVYVDIQGNVHVHGTEGMAGVARVPAGGGLYTVGEAGRETVVLPGGSSLLTAGQTMQRDLTGGGQVVNNYYSIKVEMPVGTPTAEVGRYVTDAIDAFERRSGRRRRAVA